jgi:hypothetical protein
MSASELGVNEQEFRTFGIFYPYSMERTLEAVRKNQRFVYYTSADTAMRIIRSQEIWMRKSHLMNDYREIEHGFDCLNRAYGKYRDRMASVLDDLFPGFCERLETQFNNWLPHFRTDTYITCISEHDPLEDQHGRLSMWRAYGGGAGVAIVVNGGPLARPTQALKAYTSPVAYCSDKDVEREFLRLIKNIEDNVEFVKSLGEDLTQNHMFSALRYAVLCTKHPGFHEEREWRVIYSPTFQKSSRIVSAIESVDGTPQSICKIPLKDVPDEGLYGLELPKLIDRIIVGPSKYPFGIYEAFAALLNEAGMLDAANKVIVSDVPLRQ